MRTVLASRARKVLFAAEVCLCGLSLARGQIWVCFCLGACRRFNRSREPVKGLFKAAISSTELIKAALAARIGSSGMSVLSILWSVHYFQKFLEVQALLVHCKFFSWCTCRSITSRAAVHKTPTHTK